MKLDMSIESVEGRKEYLYELLDSMDNPTGRELERMADYLIFASEIERRGPLLTANRMVTVNKRETSMEGLTDKLEGGESAFHALIHEDRNTILTPRTQITQHDLDTIPELRKLREAIDDWAPRVKEMEGLDRYRATRMLIDMRRDQYLVRASFRPVTYSRSYVQPPSRNEGVWNGEAEDHIDLRDPRHVSHILANYSALKQDSHEDLKSEVKWILEDLDSTMGRALEDEPVLEQILISKIDGESNESIQKTLEEKYGVTHSQEYISSLYRNRIPELIVDQKREDWVDYMYTFVLKGDYKQCTRCNEVKLAMNRYFSINRTSSSLFYSICKVCRSNVEQSRRDRQ